MDTLVEEEGTDEVSSSGSSRAPGRRAGSRITQLAAPLATPAVAAIVVLGIVARFVSTSELWLDEALSANIASLGVGDLLEALRHDGHPPLYYLLLHGWMQVFGEGDVAVRALSAVFGIAMLPLVWAAGRRLAGRSGGRWALVVTALSPFAVRYSNETRMYSLVMLLVLAGYVLVCDALVRPEPKRLAGIAVLTGLLLLTHYWSFYLLGSVGLLLALRWWRRPDERTPSLRVLLAIAAGGLLFLPWIGSFLYQAGHTGTPWGAPYRPTELVQSTLGDMGGGVYTEAFLFASVMLILMLVALFARGRTGAEGHDLVLDLRTTPTVRTELAVATLTAGLGCVAGYLTGAAYQSRYAAVFIPLLLLAIAVGIATIPGIARFVAGATVVGLSLAGLLWSQYYQRTQSDVVAGALAEHVEPGDVVVYCPDQLGPAYSRAIGRVVPEGVSQLAYPTLEAPERVDWVEYQARNEAADPDAIAQDVIDRADGNGIFVVWMSEYRTFGDQCEGLVNAIGQADQLVEEDGKKYFEPANLHWFPAGRAGEAGAADTTDAPPTSD